MQKLCDTPGIPHASTDHNSCEYITSILVLKWEACVYILKSAGIKLVHPLTLKWTDQF